MAAAGSKAAASADMVGSTRAEAVASGAGVMGFAAAFAFRLRRTSHHASKPRRMKGESTGKRPTAITRGMKIARATKRKPSP